MIDSLYLPLVARLFIFLLWKLLSSKLFNLIPVDKKNLFTALKSFISALDFDWPYSHPVKLSISFNDMHCHITIVWLIISF